MEGDRMDIQIEGRAMNYIEQGIKVGDKVWTIQFGDVRVVDIGKDGPYKILVGVGEIRERYRYTSDGRYWDTDHHPSLFWSNPNIIPPPKPEPLKYQWLYRLKGSKTWYLAYVEFSELQDLLAFAPYLSLEIYEFKRLDP